MRTRQAVGRLIAVGAMLAFAIAAGASESVAATVGDTLAFARHNEGAAPAQEKANTVGGALAMTLPVTFFLSNPDRTVNFNIARLQNDSYANTSGLIKLRLFFTTTPISGAYSDWIVGEYTLDPLAPRAHYDNLNVTAPLVPVPDGIYYVYLGAFEHEDGCGTPSGYCSDDLYLFTNRMQVSDGVYSFYAPPGATGLAVEYYWASRDHYFFSTNPAEIAALDASPPGGWVRTGYTFGTYATALAGTSPVCRFYIPPAYGDSHYYSASPAECAATRAAFPVLVYESPSVTDVFLPNSVTGTCPIATAPVYRLWNNRVDSNHRYTTSIAIRDLMLSRGYVPEGYGPDPVSACAPQ